MPFTKPLLTVPLQRVLLESRGMAIPDSAKAEEYLRRIGYYRLSAYWYPFRKLRQINGEFVLDNAFKTGTDFRHATDLYAFDKTLRLLVLDAIERIEISVRTEIALALGRHNPLAHRKPAMLDKNFTNGGSKFSPTHNDWLKRLDDKASASKEEFAVHFRKKYPGEHMPIWIAVELLDFGPLSIFLSGMRYADLQAVSQSYGGLRPHLIKSWIRSFSTIRNVCAHHSRLWNKPLVDQPVLPKLSEIPELDHVVSAPGSNRRLYAALAIMKVLLKQVNPRTKWGERLKTHLATFPKAPNIKIADAGFPEDWEELALWN